MSTLIPNENCFIAFSPTHPASVSLIPTASEVAAAVDVTDFIINLNASETGNVVPTPKLKSRFETSIPGTVTGAFTAEMYRDSVPANDDAWTALPLDQTGVFYINRFESELPIIGDHVEVWVVRVSSRTPSAMASNTAQTFTLTCSLPEVPNQDALIAA